MRKYKVILMHEQKHWQQIIFRNIEASNEQFAVAEAKCLTKFPERYTLMYVATE